MENILWWHWIVLGIILVLMELVVPSFTIFWFGLGADGQEYRDPGHQAIDHYAGLHGATGGG